MTVLNAEQTCLPQEPVTLLRQASMANESTHVERKQFLWVEITMEKSENLKTQAYLFKERCLPVFYPEGWERA